jgi:hypothetical protein
MSVNWRAYTPTGRTRKAKTIAAVMKVILPLSFMKFLLIVLTLTL